MRRVITGVDEAGRSTVISDETLEPTDKWGGDHFEVWDADMSAAPPWVTGDAGPWDFEPGPGWVKCMQLTFPPAEGENLTTADRFWHKTSTIDVVLALDPLVLILEDREVEVGAGDVVIQQGTLHDWQNRADRPARCLGFSYGISAGQLGSSRP